jgi:hypothetical protein
LRRETGLQPAGMVNADFIAFWQDDGKNLLFPGQITLSVAGKKKNSRGKRKKIFHDKTFFLYIFPF